MEVEGGGLIEKCMLSPGGVKIRVAGDVGIIYYPTGGGKREMVTSYHLYTEVGSHTWGPNWKRKLVRPDDVICVVVQ